ncbi:hypothetical protein DBR11_08760 [Pedobacter sp. HMWF019]|uniref:YbbC/YhhH family protein n=1 Tax=Pedobacter sp. HMWF019 TaxID=2056856 RepID=UPI000D3A938E|nr:YbbC/YhhH family protein [Pedobacter sp. HMWF019]PTT00884.1 hypothetical protein DBR11_08760 [Pedobacter sp. HMWF019]
MKKTALLSIMSITMLLLTSCQHSTEQKEWDVSQGYVPDSTTAVQIAQILFVRVYGEKVLEKKPFVATLKNGNVWVVEGTLKEQKGGVPHLEMQKSDGKIIYLIHGK